MDSLVLGSHGLHQRSLQGLPTGQIVTFAARPPSGVPRIASQWSECGSECHEFADGYWCPAVPSAFESQSEMNWSRPQLKQAAPPWHVTCPHVPELRFSHTARMRCQTLGPRIHRVGCGWVAGRGGCTQSDGASNDGRLGAVCLGWQRLSQNGCRVVKQDAGGNRLTAGNQPCTGTNLRLMLLEQPKSPIIMAGTLTC